MDQLSSVREAARKGFTEAGERTLAMLLWMESSSSLVIGEAFGCMKLVAGRANVAKVSPRVELGEPGLGSWLYDVAAMLEAALDDMACRVESMRVGASCISKRKAAQSGVGHSESLWAAMAVAKVQLKALVLAQMEAIRDAEVQAAKLAAAQASLALAHAALEAARQKGRDAAMRVASANVVARQSFQVPTTADPAPIVGAVAVEAPLPSTSLLSAPAPPSSSVVPPAAHEPISAAHTQVACPRAGPIASSEPSKPSPFASGVAEIQPGHPASQGAPALAGVHIPRRQLSFGRSSLSQSGSDLIETHDPIKKLEQALLQVRRRSEASIEEKSPLERAMECKGLLLQLESALAELQAQTPSSTPIFDGSQRNGKPVSSEQDAAESNSDGGLSEGATSSASSASVSKGPARSNLFHRNRWKSSSRTRKREAVRRQLDEPTVENPQSRESPIAEAHSTRPVGTDADLTPVRAAARWYADAEAAVLKAEAAESDASPEVT